MMQTGYLSPNGPGAEACRAGDWQGLVPILNMSAWPSHPAFLEKDFYFLPLKEDVQVPIPKEVCAVKG